MRKRENGGEFFRREKECRIKSKKEKKKRKENAPRSGQKKKEI